MAHGFASDGLAAGMPGRHYLFIAGHLDGFQRGSRSRRADTGANAARHKLDAEPWLREALVTHIGPNADTDMLAKLGGGAFSKNPHREELLIRALVEVDTESCIFVDDSNMVRPSSRQGELQMLYYQHPRDAYELRIKRVHLLQQPEAIIGRRSSKIRDGGFVGASPANPLFLPFWGQRHPGCIELQRAGDATPIAPCSPCSDDILDPDIDVDLDCGVDTIDSCVRHDLMNDETIDIREFPCLLLPDPIVRLIEKNEWSKILLLARWHQVLREPTCASSCRPLGPISDWPSEHSAVWECVGKNGRPDTTQTALPMTSDTLKRFAANAAAWGSEAASVRASDEKEEVQGEVKRMFDSLSSWHHSLDDKAGASNGLESDSMRHDSRILLQSIRQASLLRGGASKLCDVHKL